MSGLLYSKVPGLQVTLFSAIVRGRPLVKYNLGKRIWEILEKSVRKVSPLARNQLGTLSSTWRRDYIFYCHFLHPKFVNVLLSLYCRVCMHRLSRIGLLHVIGTKGRYNTQFLWDIFYNKVSKLPQRFLKL